MRKRWLLSIVTMLFSFVASFAANPEEGTCPTVGGLFHIARGVNENLVCYDVNLRDGRLDMYGPLSVYWVSREKHPGKTNGLNYIQRKVAYGYKPISVSNNTYVCSLTAYPSHQSTITKRDSRYVYYITVNSQQAILQSLYVKVNSKDPLGVKCIGPQGISAAMNQPVTERVRRWVNIFFY